MFLNLQNLPRFMDIRRYYDVLHGKVADMGVFFGVWVREHGAVLLFCTNAENRKSGYS
ncbi:hypothetical protein [Bartonella raoultii]|uniref:hypothetical protein n=1 Tax=Bartonella raoultii TaxID=1457020 RepID=UPI001ABBB9EC|nr:hypothetical protein [Bartonella raoultii]